jgi:hypothetical protein
MAMLGRVQDRLMRADSGAPPFVVVAVTAAALLTACSSSAPPPQPAPSPVAPRPTVEPTPAAALAAYGEFWRLSDAGFAAPKAKDWQIEIAKVASSQALADVALEIRNYASVPAHLEGTIDRTPTVDPTIPSTADRVAILDCIDISRSRLVSDSNGAVLDDVTNQADRYRYRAQVVKVADGRWLVERTAPALTEPC